MMNFFKSLFKKKEEVVKLGEFERWFEVNLKPRYEDVKNDLESVKTIKGELQENLKRLEKVEVKGEVQQKVKDVVQGNVPAYIRAVEIFLEKINIPEETNSQKLLDFYATIQRELDQLGKRTARNFAIMQTLIGEELAATARDIKKIDESSKGVMKKAQKIRAIEKIKTNVEQAQQAEKNKEEHKRLREDYEKEKNKLIKERDDAGKNLKKLDEGKEAKELTRFNKDLENLETSRKEIDNELLSLFSPLQKAFKRYNNMFYIKKVEDYINNAAETLKQDNELEIVKYLRDIKKMIEEGKIDIKEDKKKKALESLEKLDEGYLKKFIKEHEYINKEKEIIHERTKENKYLAKKEELQKEIEEKERRIGEIEKELGKIKEVNIKEQVDAIEKELRELGYEVKIHAMD